MSCSRSSFSLDQLERRSLMSTTLAQTNLVSDQFGVAQIRDDKLTDPWGISGAPSAGAFWVSAGGSHRSPLYFGDFGSTPLARLFSVRIPGGTPTGQVFNINQPIMGTGNSTDFSVSAGSQHGASVFIFATKGGAITGWNPAVGQTIAFGGGMISGVAEVGFQAHDGAVYTGLAAGNVGSSHFLYAADFHNGKIDVVNGQFHKTTLSGSFHDSNLPSGFAPYNIQNLNGKLYVTYAKQDAARDGGAVSGAGKGYVDVFDTSGHLLRRAVAGGQLNTPYGVAIAPNSFGDFDGDLLVANNGDGHIEAYDPAHNFAFDGQLKGTNGNAITIPGLRALQFGNGVSAGDSNALYFNAAPNNGAHGLFGSLRIAPIVSVTQVMGANNSLTLRVRGTAGADTVSITEDLHSGTVTVISNGHAQVFDHTFSHFDIQLGANDKLTFDVA